MLKDLKILNGILDLNYNEYIYEYTVSVDESVSNLEFDYVLNEDSYINVRNNIITDDESIVYLDVYNVDKTITYTFYVYKENTEQVSGIDNYVKKLETQNNSEISVLKVQILTTSMFIVIVILFTLIFKRKHT